MKKAAAPHLRRVVAVLASTVAMLVAAAVAEATPITFDFTATQTTNTTPSGLAAVAAPFVNISGSFTWDTAVAASSNGLTISEYPTGSIAIDQFDIGTAVLPRPVFTVVGNDSAGFF